MRMFLYVPSEINQKRNTGTRLLLVEIYLLFFMKNIPEVNKIYDIKFTEGPEYQHYTGQGKFTGKSDDIDGMCYEFELLGEDFYKQKTALFPLDSVFPIG